MNVFNSLYCVDAFLPFGHEVPSHCRCFFIFFFYSFNLPWPRKISQIKSFKLPSCSSNNGVFLSPPIPHVVHKTEQKEEDEPSTSTNPVLELELTEEKLPMTLSRQEVSRYKISTLSSNMLTVLLCFLVSD